MSADKTQSEFSLLRRILTDRSVPAVDATAPLNENSDAKRTYDDLVAIRDILKQFSEGNFDSPVLVRGILAGYLKTLQANLRHITWQVEQVAAGDFSQRVDFMGDFSKAFNMLAGQLETSIEQLKEQEAERRAAMLLNSISTIVLLFDDSYQLTDANLSAVKAFGFETKEDFFKLVKDVGDLSPKYQPNGKLSSEESMKYVKYAIENGHSVFFWQHRRFDGELIPSEVTLHRIIRDDKAYIISSIQDLRELMKTRKMLERQQRSFRSILNSSPVCLTIIRDGIVRYVTPFMTELLGVELGDVLADYFKDSILAEHLLTEVEKHSVKWRQVSIVTKQGAQKEMLANLFLTDYFNEPGVAAWFIDVTKIRQYEAELVQARNAAENLARLKGEFLRNVSHEIKTPMNAITGLLHLIKDTGMSEEQAGFVKNIEYSSQMLMQLVNNVLDFSAIEDNELTLDYKEFSPAELIDALVSDVRKQCSENQLEFLFLKDDSLPKRIIGDAVRLRQVLEHILDNAVKFTPKGSITLEVKSQMLETAQVELRISVTDTGIGFGENDLQDIFSPFRQADGSLKRLYGGTGLGLSICRGIVERMGGTIWAESKEYQGSKFAFTVRFDVPHAAAVLTPQKPDEDNIGNTKDATADQVIIPEHLKAASILIADDNRINQMVIVGLLKHEFQVDVASNGKEAIEKFQRKKYALILMDIQMPEMDGIEASQLIRKLPDGDKIPIVALTANDSAAECNTYLVAGMNDVLGKPVNADVLFRTIIRWAVQPAT
ncbi:MAG: ATP-binding protein [Planctomycetaceae bacterium]|nr:ATP-binding protein [Planctomycetaceae bacterium]